MTELSREGAGERMVCKHCGGENFHADVEVRAEAWIDGTGVWVGDDGKPHFEPAGRPQDVYADFDYDVNRYVCSDCEKGHWRLEELVTYAPEPAAGPIAPCGRCDHGRREHPEQPSQRTRVLGLERGPMPCTRAGCDCHDYYDLAVADEGQPADLLATLGHAA